MELAAQSQGVRSLEEQYQLATYRRFKIKRLFQISVVLAALICSASAAFACSCVADPLDQRYRNATAVFIGQAVDSAEDQPKSSLVQGDGEQTIAVIRAWKGVTKRYVSLTFATPPQRLGNCLILFSLEPGKQYLVFAYGKKLEARSVCSDTWVIPSEKDSGPYEVMQGYIRKLNSRRFRQRAARMKLS